VGIVGASRQQPTGKVLALRLLVRGFVQTSLQDNSLKWPARAGGGLKPLARNTVYMVALQIGR